MKSGKYKNSEARILEKQFVPELYAYSAGKQSIEVLKHFLIDQPIDPGKKP